MKEKLAWLSAAIIGIGTLAVTSRRWSAPLLASALGMGLFVGVAFGPALDTIGASGSQVIAVQGTPPPTATADATPPTDQGLGGGGSASGGGGTTSASSSTDAVDTATTTPYSAPVPTTEPVPTEEPVEEPTDEGGSTDPGTDGDTGGDFTLAGTVVQVNPVAGTYALAVRGELYGVHAKDLPAPGDQVEAPLIALLNGAYAEDGERTTSGTTKSGTLNGFVTWVSAEGEPPAYVVSAKGASIPIEVLAEGDAELPEVGEFVSVETTIDELEKGAGRRGADDADRQAEGTPEGSCVREEPAEEAEPRARLVQKEIEPTGDEFTYFDLSGTVQAICPEAGEILLSADDLRQTGADLTLAVPKEIDVADLEVDQPVLATAELGEDGSLTLAGIASNEGIDEADDADLLQGDLAG